MMGITEKAAHLQGLAEGLAIDDSTKEGKLLLALLGVVSEMADAIADLDDSVDELDQAIEDLEEAVTELDEVVDVLDEDLANVEELFADELEDDDACGCGHHHHHEVYEDDDEDDDDEVDFEDFEDQTLYEVVCPKCADSIYLDEGMLEEGSMDCPSCGELLEFDFEVSEDEE